MRFGKRWVLFERYVVRDADGVYLDRLRIIETPWFRVYFHRILRSDKDRHLHDHPWSFLSIILRGGYWEHTEPRGFRIWAPTERAWKKQWSVIRHKATDLHRLELPEGESVWTLVFAGRRIREWGFQTENGWVPWREYLKEAA